MDIGLDGEWDRHELNSAFDLAERRPLILMILGVIVVTILTGSGLLGVLPWPVIVIAGPLIVGLVTFVLRWNRSQQLDAPIVQGRVTGQITERSVTLVSAQGQATNSWSTATKYVANDEAIIIRQGGAAGFMLLRNWFANEADWQRLRRSIDQLIGSQTPTPENTAPAPENTAPAPENTAPAPGTAPPTGDPPAIAYGGELNVAELSGLYRHIRAFRWAPRVALGVAALGLPAGLVFAIGAGSLPTSSGPLAASLALVILALMLMAIPRLLATFVIRMARTTAISGQASRLGIEQRGLAEGTSSLRWSAFARASISDSGVSLHLHENGPFIPVLRSWFDDTMAWDRFVALVEEQVRT